MRYLGKRGVFGEGKLAHLCIALILATVGADASAQTREDFVDAARALPPMPRDAEDLIPLLGRGPTFGSGTPYNDVTYTALTTDYMEGETAGFDTFVPVDPSDPTPGADTIKLVRGVNNLDLEAAYDGPRGDRIVLGDHRSPLPYFRRGADGVDNDYVVIQNFDYDEGYLQLPGALGDYRLLYLTLEDGVQTEGHYLFYRAADGPDLIAFAFPCDDIALPISGNPPRDDQVLCNESRRWSEDAQLRFDLDRGDAPAIGFGIQFGSTGKEIGGGVATDGEGNRYWFGASDGDVGEPENGNAIFVVQFEASGRRGWTFELPMKTGSLIFDATADEEYLYAAGRTLGELPGFSNAGRWDAILLKLRLADGALVAAHQFGRSGLDGYGNVELDGAGHVYVSGAGSPEMASGTDAAYLVAKYEAETLEPVWQMIEPPDDDPVFVSEAWGGLSYVPPRSGRPGRLVAGGWYMSFGGANGFLAIYENLDGLAPERVGAVNIASPGNQADWVLDNAVDSAGNIYAAGFTTGLLGDQALGDGDAYVAKFSPDLTNPQFVQVGTNRSDMFRKLAVDERDRLYAVGYTYGELVPGSAPLGFGDLLVYAFDDQLNQLARRRLGSTGEDRSGLALTDTEVVLGGLTEGAFAGPNQGSYDAFVLSLDRDDLSSEQSDVILADGFE